MAFHLNGDDCNGNMRGLANISNPEYSGDEHEPTNVGGSERADSDLLVDKPIYLLEHLATFTVNKESGIMYPADGMRRLLQLEKTTGIWSQKMQLCLDHQWILIIDYETGNIIERFPATLIQEPTAFTSTDAMELYNNILVFVVSGGTGVRSEMHIFQSQSVSAVQLVEHLKNLRSGKKIKQSDIMPHRVPQNQSMVINRLRNISPYNSLRGEHHHFSHQAQRHNSNSDQFGNTSGNAESDSELGAAGAYDETSSIGSDKYERDVTVLNHCFDDIEKFIARLQHAAAAARELERRRRNRKSKKKDPGEGLLTLRTRPPHEKEFIDIFAKFKLSFNLLAKLKSHIHDPNAPELVHFLFTPLALIVEAASDTYFESQLPARVINPLLTREAINLLVNCVTSKETELWRSLGDAWVVPRDQWKDNVGSYHPVFMDGWSPDYLVIDETVQKPTRKEIQSMHHISLDTDVNERSPIAQQSGFDNYDGSLLNEKYITHRGQVDNEFTERLSINSVERNTIETTKLNTSGPVSNTNSRTMGLMQSLTTELHQLHTRDPRLQNTGVGSGDNNVNIPESKSQQSRNNSNTNDEQKTESWLDQLHVSGAKVVLVTYPRTANNDKELSVTSGEYLEILDDSRKWWKARNIHGHVGHVPHTIVTAFHYGTEEGKILNNQFNRPPQQKNESHNAYTSRPDNVDSNAFDTNEWVRKKYIGKKGEFRYF